PSSAFSRASVRTRTSARSRSRVTHNVRRNRPESVRSGNSNANRSAPPKRIVSVMVRTCGRSEGLRMRGGVTGRHDEEGTAPPTRVKDQCDPACAQPVNTCAQVCGRTLVKRAFLWHRRVKGARLTEPTTAARKLRRVGNWGMGELL